MEMALTVPDAMLIQYNKQKWFYKRLKVHL